MSEQQLIDEVVQNIEEYETDSGEIRGLMNEYANHYRMIDTRKDPRPHGVSKSITADTPRAVNALASSITRMQTNDDPNFEIRSSTMPEDKIFQLEKKYQRELENFEFKRNLAKGNRGLCLFGTQVWEEPYIKKYVGGVTPFAEGTAFNPLSFLQIAFRAGVYNIDFSDFFATMNKFSPGYLRHITNTTQGVWNKQLVEQAIKENGATNGQSQSLQKIDERRDKAKYQQPKEGGLELILYHGRVNTENDVIKQMWQSYQRTDDPAQSDITVGILNRKYLVRLHPTPYGTWRHMHKIGHYEEFELEPIAYGVGKMGLSLQKDMNRILSRCNDTALFNLYHMLLTSDGSSLNTNQLNIFPFAMLKVRDVAQVRELNVDIQGLFAGLKLNEATQQNFKAVTHATDTLQAITTGATAHESSMAQGEAIRAVSLIAEINTESVIKPHLYTMHVNFVDQNPYDNNVIRDIEFSVKCTTDKDYRPEHANLLLKFFTLVTSIRQQLPIDFNPEPIIKYLARASGIDPREFKNPRPQIDKTLDMLRRVSGNGGQAGQEIAGEVAGANGLDTNVPNIPAPIPSPASGMANQMGVI